MAAAKEREVEMRIKAEKDTKKAKEEAKKDEEEAAQLGKPERNATPTVDEIFDLLDDNDDGELTVEEVVSNHKVG